MSQARQYTKGFKRITIPPLPPDNSADVSIMVGPHDIVLTIGSDRWVFPQHKWDKWTEPEK